MKKRLVSIILGGIITVVVSCSAPQKSVVRNDIDHSKAELPEFSYKGAKLVNEKDNGYQGIWYLIGNRYKVGDYTNKYGGGLGTYPVNIYPFSVYSPKVKKTFFCYGGASDDNVLYHEVGYYNHKNGKVSKPTIVIDKKTKDGHDNPCMQMDKDGYIWLYSNSHGTSRPAFIHRSKKPYDISEFENVYPTKLENGKEVALNNFSYLQMYYEENSGFLALFTHYEAKDLKNGRGAVRVASYMTSKDGIHWSEWQDLADIHYGSYQNSGQRGKLVGTAFNHHPDVKERKGLDYRTNLYYLQTNDFGQTWTTVQGESVNLPVTEIDNKALVYDYNSEGLNVYINDVNFDANNNPIIMYETSKGWEPGPENGPRQWYTAHWTGDDWKIQPITTSDHNYDMGSLYVESDGTWRIIAPTDPGGQPYYTGGGLVMWTSNNQGASWERVRDMTPNSKTNHSYPRRPIDAHPDFYSFWADGDGEKVSKSGIYFSNKKGDVFKLPTKMEKDEEKPIKAY